MNRLKIKFVTRYEVVSSINPHTGREVRRATETGTVHIFLIIEQGGYEELADYSLCNITRSEVGPVTSDNHIRPQNLPLCPDCELAWKSHPLSPWKAWVQI